MTDKRTIDAAVAYAACFGYDLAEEELADLRAQVAALTAERDALVKRIADAPRRHTNLTEDGQGGAYALVRLVKEDTK